MADDEDTQITTDGQGEIRVVPAGEVWQGLCCRVIWPNTPSPTPQLMIELDHITEPTHQVHIKVYRLHRGKHAGEASELVGEIVHHLSESLFDHILPKYHAGFSQNGRYGIVCCADPTTTIYCLAMPRDNEDGYDFTTSVTRTFLRDVLISEKWPLCASDDLLLCRSNWPYSVYALALPSLELVDRFGGVDEFSEDGYLNWSAEFNRLKRITSSTYLHQAFAFSFHANLNHQNTFVDQNTLVLHQDCTSETIAIQMVDVEHGLVWTYAEIETPEDHTMWSTAGGILYRDGPAGLKYLMTVMHVKRGGLMLWSVPISQTPSQTDAGLKLTPSDVEIDFRSPIRRLLKGIPDDNVLSMEIEDIVQRMDLDPTGRVFDILVYLQVSHYSMTIAVRYDARAKTFSYNRVLRLAQEEFFERRDVYDNRILHMQDPNYTCTEIWNACFVKLKEDELLISELKDASNVFLRYKDEAMSSWLFDIPELAWEYYILPQIDDDSLLNLVRSDPRMLIFLNQQSARLRNMILDRIVVNQFLAEIDTSGTSKQRRDSWLLLAARAGHGEVLKLLQDTQ